MLRGDGISAATLLSTGSIALCVGTAGAAAAGVALFMLLDTRRQVRRLRQDLQVVAPGPGSHGSFSDESQAAELRKTQAVVAAAGASFDKKLTEIKKQVDELRTAVFLGRGNSLTSEDLPSGGRARADTEGSEVGSETGSAAASATGSTISVEESTELKKMRAVVAAAAKTFSTQLGDVRRTLRELQAEVRGESRLPR
eukprot:gb/GFBE01006121.1/.p1 GENE.gb/GFBE01006121.1/~~gb/GFBE01006121.1/.p1  ORF type:complete len:198 (+),score=44.03 gb/GFBE01006121.1/:1-594(+)